MGKSKFERKTRQFKPKKFPTTKDRHRIIRRDIDGSLDKEFGKPSLGAPC